MYIFLTQEDRNRLIRMANEMGVPSPYYYHCHSQQQQYLLSQDGSLTAVQPDTFIVDMIEKIDERIKRVEEACSSLQTYG